MTERPPQTEIISESGSFGPIARAQSPLFLWNALTDQNILQFQRAKHARWRSWGLELGHL